MEHIVIIGNGISGVTLARHIRKQSDSKITIISSETEFFFSRTALMYVFMGHMKFEHTQPYENDFWKKNNINLIHKRVTEVLAKEKSLLLGDNSSISFDKLVIATGSTPNKFGWPGQDLQGVTGLYDKQDLEALEKWAPTTKRAVIVGGGLIGIELAEMLRSRNIPVTFLVREKSFWSGVLPFGESQMINRHILEHHIDLRLETNLVEILSDENGHVKAIITDKNETIECELVGLTAGVSPNVSFLKNSGIELGRGVKVNRFLETNIKGIYAIGDCAEQHEGIDLRRPIEAVWYTGRMMGEALAQTLTGKPTQYNPGHWFNSAKFLDIEYQTYGWVWAQAQENENHFYWEHKDGKKAIRISFHQESRVFLGINTFGIRMRHEFFDKVLTDKKTVDYVMHHLAEANFDPEFFTNHDKEIQQQFTNEFIGLKTE
ncbi:NAD(P)/FAD-dependent oxidoreductase [Flavobacterium degerlachei]|jgi:NAD(P)H-nitrite reductase large subunit|uniref:Pyridine nucleotide-disulphide oxidoreductase n=1 Tax=Flavobacterium degerlachei TaxID=229203 RepID=A0A1H2ZIM3_9FLAO|nr:FAD/NAD(P)-binding oxidoreductase [Flavobacterium degerlachei]SDX16569.1 Pyridine nucleotide-disulphide oxidoreductase [Flavobacterium degerlachei]